jgi:hypothetical protein
MGSPVLVGMPTLRTLNPLFYQELQYCTSNVSGFDPVTFPFPPDIIKLTGGPTGYAGVDVIGCFFNQDQGLNYWDRSLVSAAGGVVVADVPNANSGLIRFGNPTNKGRVFDITIFNFISRNKVMMVNNQIGSGLAGTPAEINGGAGGEWLNVLQQISRIDFKTAGGAKITAGSTLLVQAWAGMHN